MPEDQKCCPCCKKPFIPFLGTQDSDVVEVEVKAHIRRIKRKRYKAVCSCSAVPAIITAKGPDKTLREAADLMHNQCCEQLKDKKLTSPCKKVLTSLKNHWTGLTLFIDYLEIPMDNNAAERALRGPVVGRKNFYGSGSLWSGTLAATMFTIFQTLNLWNINPRTWLHRYFQACAKEGGKPPTDISPYLPWNMEKQSLCGTTKQYDTS